MPRLRCSSTRASVIWASAGDAVRPARCTNPAVIRPYSAFPISNSPSPESSITWFTSRDASSSGRIRCCVSVRLASLMASRSLSTTKIKSNQEILALGPNVGLEVEGALRPGEQVVDRFLDLHAHVALEVRLGDHGHPDEDLPQLLAMLLGLPLDRRFELALGDLAVLHQDVAQPVAPIHDGGIADSSLLEVDVAEVRAIGDGEASRFLSQGEQLKHVGERCLLERAFDGHQRKSSITRSATSTQSHTTFSRLLMPPRLETTSPLARKPRRRVSRGAWPSSTSRASPAESGPSCAAAAPTTRCKRPTRLRTESVGRSAR